ncbi:MAG: hypothetical protein VKO39_06330 [Cyanobacteriota bacterium]|nr:hypothetical protein [Cyanobacteriota bacterium]
MPPRPVESSPAQGHIASHKPNPSETPPTPWLERFQGGLDRLLVVDVFLVLAGALWFGLGVVLHLRGADSVLALFQRLWFPLFQPALGLLMLAALLSGALGWWRRRGPR